MDVCAPADGVDHVLRSDFPGPSNTKASWMERHGATRGGVVLGVGRTHRTYIDRWRALLARRLPERGERLGSLGSAGAVEDGHVSSYTSLQDKLS